jgi:hypothetical protein
MVGTDGLAFNDCGGGVKAKFTRRFPEHLAIHAIVHQIHWLGLSAKARSDSQSIQGE